MSDTDKMKCEYCGLQYGHENGCRALWPNTNTASDNLHAFLEEQKNPEPERGR